MVLLKEQVQVAVEKLDFLNDAMAKALLRSEVGKRIIARVFSPFVRISEEKILKAIFSGGEHLKINRKEKGKVSDIIIWVGQKTAIIIEVNKSSYKGLSEKNTAYAYTNYLGATKISEKEHPKVILVNIDNFNTYHTKSPYIHFQVRDETGKIIENDCYESFHFILENMAKCSYNGRYKELVKFAFFFQADTYEKLEEYFKGDEDYMELIEIAKQLSIDPEFIGYYDIEKAHEKAIRDASNGAYEDGEAQGIKIGEVRGEAQGRKKEQKNIVEKLLKTMTVPEIAKLLGMKVSEINKILM